jgi:hypothetical protein
MLAVIIMIYSLFLVVHSSKNTGMRPIKDISKSANDLPAKSMDVKGKLTLRLHGSKNSVQQKDSCRLLNYGAKLGPRARKRSHRDLESPSTHTSTDKELPSGGIMIVCKLCRKECKARNGRRSHQQTINSFLFVPNISSSKFPADPSASDHCAADILFCSLCRRVMEEMAFANNATALSTSAATISAASRRPSVGSVCPALAKLRGYRRTARDKGVIWNLTDTEALAMMSLPCTFCGLHPFANPGGFNGINRLNHSVVISPHKYLHAVFIPV